jgi:2-oxoglutarate dehydrogenase E1 component
MTPKSLLRHPAAASSIDDLVSGHFQPVLDDAQAAEHPAGVERLVLCSGKVAIDLLAAAESHDQRRRMAVIRIEQLYPFPERELEGILATYPWAREMIWLQEEPYNMGAWTYMSPRLQALAGEHLSLRYAGRPEHASTAEGQAETHALEQARLLEEALAGGSEPTEHLETAKS